MASRVRLREARIVGSLSEKVQVFQAESHCHRTFQNVNVGTRWPQRWPAHPAAGP